MHTLIYFEKKNDRETESSLGLEQINMSHTWRGTALTGTYTSVSTRFTIYLRTLIKQAVLKSVIKNKTLFIGQKMKQNIKRE